MLRLVLLAVFPLVALCSPPSGSASREDVIKMLEEHAKPCIVNNVNCPPGNIGWDFESFAPIVRQMQSYRLPAECNCDISAESCVRPCYYAVMLKTYRQSVIAGKTDPTEIANAERQIVELFETWYKPCVLENKNCELVGGLSYEQMHSQVQNAIKMYSLPDECNYETETEAAIRVCYYAYMKRSALAAFPDRK